MDPLFMSLPNLEPGEWAYLQNLIKDLDDTKKQQFFLMYQGRRRDPQMILLLALLGFVGVAGVHRMMMNEIGLGVVYLLTGGICLIGTIIDLFNYKKLATDYNMQVATQLRQML